MKRGRTLLAAVCLGIASSRAVVQTQTQAPSGPPPTIDEIRKSYRLHAGPLYINPKLLVKELGIDSNVFNQNETQDPKSDFTFTLTPVADLALPVSRRALITTTLGVDGVYYQQYSSERSLNPYATVRIETYFNRLTPFAESSYVNTRERPSYEVDIRPRHQHNDLRLGGRVRLTSKFSVEASTARGMTRYQDDEYYGQRLQEAFDSVTQGFNVTARQRLSGLTTLALRYDLAHDRFRLAPERDADSFSIVPGVELKPRALIAGRAFVGYRHFAPTNQLVPDYSGLVSQLALSYTLLGSTTFGVTYDRDVHYSFNLSTPYYVDNSPGFFLRRQIAGNYDVIGTVARHTYTYRALGAADGTNPGATLVGPSQTTNSYDVNLGYRLKRQVRIGVSVNNSARVEEAPLPSYRTLRVRATLTYGVIQ